MVNKIKDISSIREKTHKGVDKVMDKAEDVGERGKEEMAHLKEKAEMMKEDVDGYILKNPEKSVLIATGIGMALGAIIAATLIRRKY